MISNQELSAQQVISYLVGYEDHFTSHEYSNLYWTSFEGHINREDPSPECYPANTNTSPDPQKDAASEDVVPGQDDEENGEVTIQDEDVDRDRVDFGNVGDEQQDDPITLAVDVSGKLVPTANQVCDYQKRGDVLENVCVWDFVAQTHKLRTRKQTNQAGSRKSRKTRDGESSDSEDDDSDLSETEDHDPKGPHGNSNETSAPAKMDRGWDQHNILDFEERPMPRIPFLENHLESDRYEL
jgi:hypothetical protein